MILAIDPGNELSAFVMFERERLHHFGKITNDDLLTIVQHDAYDVMAVEMIASYGMAVGREVFDTCVWIGRYIQASRTAHERIYRRDVKLHLCGQVRAKDANIRQALLDRYGGKDRAIGKKKTPGPLYGLKADIWAALAVAVTYSDSQQQRRAA